jgi:hypothetical protein
VSFLRPPENRDDPLEALYLAPALGSEPAPESAFDNSARALGYVLVAALVAAGTIVVAVVWWAVTR